MRRDRLLLAVVVLGVGAGVAASAEDLRISAQVNKTTVELGAPMSLTITLEGELQQAVITPFEFPQEFQVIAQSQASNVSLGSGGLQRSMSLNYVLIAREPGTFQLGPFAVRRGEEPPIHTDPIEIIVTKPVLPPGSQQHKRITL